MHRNYLLKKRLSKGPDKIVLSAADFVFPIDTRRVSLKHAFYYAIFNYSKFSVYHSWFERFLFYLVEHSRQKHSTNYLVCYDLCSVFIWNRFRWLLFLHLPFMIVSSCHVYARLFVYKYFADGKTCETLRGLRRTGRLKNVWFSIARESWNTCN